MADVLPRRGRLGIRLGVAFTATAVGAVAVATVLALVTTTGRLDQLVTQQRDDVVVDVTAALATAHEAAGGWQDADLLPAHALAATAGAVLVVETGSGVVLPVPPEVSTFQQRRQHRDETVDPEPAPTTPSVPAPGRTPHQEPRTEDAPRPDQGDDHGEDGREGRSTGRDTHAAAVILPLASRDLPPEIDEERTAPIVVDGTVVGVARLLFTQPETLDPVPVLRRALTRNLLLAGTGAAMLGLAVAVWVTPRLTRPLRRLTAAVDRLAHGDRTARAALPQAVGELGVLAGAVDRMAEDLEREDRLRRALITDVAHEVRTPLSVLQGEVEALQDGIVPPDPAHLSSLHEEVLRLARLVDDLDAIAAAEAAGLELRREVVDLADVAASALTGLDAQLAAQGVQVEVDLSPARVRGDRQRLEQVVRNLLRNAARFSPPGGRVSLVVRPDGADAVLDVTDDGPGVPEDELAHVFERFWRGRLARGTRGSGVGLAVVAELTLAHGGRVAVANEDGRGARFTVVLPGTTTIPDSPVVRDVQTAPSP